MPVELPATSSLRAFALAARSLSFKSAAAALHVSPSALSRQIQALEDHLGTPLFRRLNPGLELTDAGQRYLADVDAVIARLETAQRTLRARPRQLRVSALESFSENWLVPNLPDFERAHPDIELAIEATLRYADFARDPVDVAIRFGVGPWEGLHAEPIVDLECFPVCCPRLARQLRRPEDLARQTLIHVAQVPDAWSQWLAAAGVPDLQPRRAVVYDHVGIALSAAASGQGVALTTGILCDGWLADGRLCRPFRLAVRSERTYHFVCRPEDLADRRITALRDWLVDRLATPAIARAVAPAATARAK